MSLTASANFHRKRYTTSIPYRSSRPANKQSALPPAPNIRGRGD
jgi:hypothetical protein